MERDRRIATAWLQALCEELGVVRDRRLLAGWAACGAFDRCLDGPSLAAALGRRLCERDDHRDEARIGRWLVDEAGEDVGAVAGAWAVRLGGLRHVAEASADGDAMRALHDEAMTAIAHVRSAGPAASLGPGTLRRLLDPMLGVLLDAERALGVSPSDGTLDLERRRRARAVPRPRAGTFLERHGQGVAALAARDGRAWWHGRFVERFGCDPPDGWWDEGPSGGWIAPIGRAEDWFDEGDERAFAEEMEARYRAEMGLPARGEGRVSAAHLIRCVEAVLPGVEIVREARLPWLGRQRLDAWVPSILLAVEYQGEQHYLPLPHWGGDAGLAARQELDERKRDACVRAGVRLVEWRYDEPVSIDAVRIRLERLGPCPLAIRGDSANG